MQILHYLSHYKLLILFLSFYCQKLSLFNYLWGDCFIRAYFHKFVKFFIHWLEGKLFNIHMVVHETVLGNLAHCVRNTALNINFCKKSSQEKNSNLWKKIDWNLNIFGVGWFYEKPRINDTFHLLLKYCRSP